MSSDNYFLSLSNNEHSRTSAFKRFQETQQFADVTLACDDVEQIQAHRVLLSAASPFFEKVLHCHPNSHPLLYIRGTLRKNLKGLIDFIYSGEVEIPAEEFEAFMILADDLKVKGLVSRMPDNTELVQEQNEEEEVKAFEGTQGELIKEVDESVYNMPENQELLRTHDEEIGESETDLDMINAPFPVEKLFELEDKVSSLLTRSPDNAWKCTECTYTSKHKGHVREHVEGHIEGISLLCGKCKKW